MRIFSRGETPKQVSRSIALTATSTLNADNVFLQPWDTKNLPKGAGPRETLTAAVIAALAADCADIASFPARAVELGTGRELENDPFVYALNVSPRAGMTAADLRAQIVYQMEYTGECYLVLVGNTITPLLAATVDIIQAAPNQHNRDGSPALIAGYIVRNLGGKELGRYNAEGMPVSGYAEGQLIHIRHPYPGSPYRADAPVARASLAIDTLAYARQASAFALRNSGQPAGLVQITDPSVDEDSINAFDRRLNSRLTDVTQRGRILVVGSEVDYKSLYNDNPAEGIKDLTELSRRDILSVWSMPESRLGLGGGRTYENQRVETSNYLRNTVAHRLGLISSALNQIARARGIVLSFDLLAPELSEQSSETALRAKELYAAGIISRDEAREMVGYAPVEQPRSIGGAVDRDTPLEVAPHGATERALTEDDWSAGYARLVDAIEDSLAEEAQRFHVRTYQEISRKLRNVNRAYERAEDVPQLSAEQLFSIPEADTYLTDRLGPMIAEAVAEMGGYAFSQLPVDIATPAKWEKIAARRMARLVKGVDANGVEVGLGWSRQLAVDVGESLQLGYKAGESVEVLAARIADKLGVDRSSFRTVGERALTIARTEANGLANETTMDAMMDSGVVNAKRWYTIGDGRTRPEHLAASGQEVPIDGKFSVGGVLMSHPHDPSAPAGQVVNCRCRMIPVVSERFLEN